MPAKKKQAPAATRPRDKRKAGKVGGTQAKQATEQAEQSLPHARFPIVGMGASAGGLEAFKKILLRHAPRQRNGLRADPAPRSDARAV